MWSMRNLFTLLVLLFVAFVLALFLVQNHSRTSDLSLDLVFVAWHLARPIPVAVLALGSLIVGFLLGYVSGYRKRGALERKIASKSAPSFDQKNAWS